MSLDDLNFTFKQGAPTTDVGMPLDEIVKSLHHSCEFFLQFFLGDELSEQVPEFHKMSWDYLTAENVAKIALALPRGHAKTTLAKLAVVWYFLFTDIRFIVYVSNTASIAAEACQDIVNFMRTQNYEQVFGPVRFEVEQNVRGHYKFYLSYIDAAGYRREKYCILRAFGAGQQVRGLNVDNKRPELAVVDDLEDDENTATQGLIMKLKTWFYGPFFKALAIKSKIIYLGNMLSAKSLLYHFCEHAEEWYSMRYGCLRSDGTPLWPEMWPFEKIKADYIEYQKVGLAGRWFAEMMNMPVADGNLLIHAEDIYYVPATVPGEQEYAFITMDCAISEKTWADDTAIVVHVFKDGLWRVAEYVVGKFAPERVFWLLIELCHKWNTTLVGMQQAAFEQAFKFLFEVLMTVNRVHFEVFPLPHGNKPKLERIAIWCAVVRKKQWALTEGEYAATEQLLMYDPAKRHNRDDLIDAISMGITMTELYMSAIMEAQAMTEDMYKVRTGYEVCRI